jgi:hypothetical protein
MIYALVLIFSMQGDFAVHAEKVVTTNEECAAFINTAVQLSGMKKFSGYCIDMSVAKKPVVVPKGSTEL